jgi:hypothetical protein
MALDVSLEKLPQISTATWLGTCKREKSTKLLLRFFDVEEKFILYQIRN